ncbi:MAG: N-acetylmuramoyl-L-alanine amidase, partial [Stellaceae bacterium]
GPRAGGIDMLVLHYTGMESAEAALARLTSPAAAVSAHYVVDEDGGIWRLVAEERRAWHAGVSSWRGRRDINGAAIGIELVNPGHEFGYRRFPEAQMAALAMLCAGILQRHPIPARHVLGHSDVAPRRKQDPGELFDWASLARAGIGLFPSSPAPDAPEAVGKLQALLAAIGYGTPQSGRLDVETGAVVAAFQRHFRPARCDGVPDAETRGLIAAVAALCGEI